MRLSRDKIEIDLRDMGINKINEGFPVFTSEIDLLDRTFDTQAKGLGARTWELGGEYSRDNQKGREGWENILNLRKQKDVDLIKMVLAEFVLVNIPADPTNLESISGIVEEAEKVADVYFTGSPRREWVELLNGRPQVYRWRFRLLEAS